MRKCAWALASFFLASSYLFAQSVTTTTPRPKPTVGPREVIAPYWTMEAGWHTELHMRNNIAMENLIVTPVLRTRSGAEFVLPAVTLLPNETRAVNLEEVLPTAAPQLLEGRNQYGSVVFRFDSLSASSIFAFVMVHRHGHPFEFHIDAEPARSGVTIASQEGIWWLPKDSTTGHFIVTNTSNRPVPASLELSAPDGRTATLEVPLGPGQTRRLDLREELAARKLKGDFGGVRFLRQPGGDVKTLLFLYDESNDFSAVMKMFHRGPSTAAKEITLRAPMMALSTPDPALGFPADTKLVPRIFIRNAGATTVPVRMVVNWRTPSQNGRHALTIAPLSLGETRLIDLSVLQSSKQIPPEADWATVALTYDGSLGDLVPVAASYQSEGRLGVQTPFSHQVVRSWKGGRWEVDNTHNSLVTIGNAGPESTTAQVTFYYDAGKGIYEMPPRKLRAGEQMWIDVGHLIRTRVPDSQGRFLPQTATYGAYDARDLDHMAIGQLYEGKIVVDKKYGHASYGCMAGCCWRYTYIDPSTKILNTGGQYAPVVKGKDCSYATFILSGGVDITWNPSSDSAVASVNSYGGVTANSAGTADISSYEILLSDDSVCDLAENFNQDVAVSVKPVISGVTPSRRIVGNSVSVTIDGSGFGSAPTVTVTGGVTVSDVSSSNTQITATFTVPTNAQTVDQTVTVTAAGQASNTDKKFRTQVPAKVIRAAYPGCTGGICSLISVNNGSVSNLEGTVLANNRCGVYRNLVFDIVDSGSVSVEGTYSLNEHFSAYSSSWSGTIPTDKTLNISNADGFVNDIQAFVTVSPSCPGANDHEVFDMTYTVTSGGTTYNLSTKHNVDRGYYTGSGGRVDHTVVTP